MVLVTKAGCFFYSQEDGVFSVVSFTAPSMLLYLPTHLSLKISTSICICYTHHHTKGIVLDIHSTSDPLFLSLAKRVVTMLYWQCGKSLQGDSFLCTLNVAVNFSFHRKKTNSSPYIFPLRWGIISIQHILANTLSNQNELSKPISKIYFSPTWYALVLIG